MLQAARISLHYSLLNTGIDEPIGGQICCSLFGDDGSEDFPLYVHEGNLLELVESCGIELFWHKAAPDKSSKPGFQVLHPQCP